MKTTTKILISFFAFTVLLAFFLAVIMMKRYDPVEATVIVIMDADGSEEVVKTAPFEKIAPIEFDTRYFYCFNRSCPFQINVAETDSVEVPTVTVNPYWKGNLSIDVVDKTLIINADMKRSVGQQKYFDSIILPDDCKYTVKIAVPRGMLREIGARSSNLELENFRDASLSMDLNRSTVRMIDCSFRNSEIDDYEYKLYVLDSGYDK